MRCFLNLQYSEIIFLPVILKYCNENKDCLTEIHLPIPRVSLLIGIQQLVSIDLWGREQVQVVGCVRSWKDPGEGAALA